MIDHGTVSAPGTARVLCIAINQAQPARTLRKNQYPTLAMHLYYLKSTYHCVLMIYLRIHVTTNLTREMRMPNNHILSNQMIVQMRTVYQARASLRAGLLRGLRKRALPVTTLLQAALDSPTPHRVNVGKEATHVTIVSE